MKINYEKKAIEMTKKFANAAGRFGSDEYRELQEARRDNPGFKVITVNRTTSAKKDSYKGLNYNYMEKYIKAHDDEENAIMAKYETLRGTSAEAKAALADACSYGEIKKWFLGQFPEIGAFHANREKLLAH